MVLPAPLLQAPVILVTPALFSVTDRAVRLLPFLLPPARPIRRHFLLSGRAVYISAPQLQHTTQMGTPYSRILPIPPVAIFPIILNGRPPKRGSGQTGLAPADGEASVITPLPPPAPHMFAHGHMTNTVIGHSFLPIGFLLRLLQPSPLFLVPVPPIIRSLASR